MTKEEIVVERFEVTKKTVINEGALAQFVKRVGGFLLISYKSKVKKIWDKVVMFIALYNAIVTPLKLSFGLPFHYLVAEEYMGKVIDFVFVTDMVMGFLTSYEDSHGREVREFGHIAKHYVYQSKFLFDSLSLLGAKFMQSLSRNLRFFGLFKVTKVLKIGKVIQKQNVPKQVKVMMKILKVVVYLVMYLHWLACTFNIILQYNSPQTYFIQTNGMYTSIFGTVLEGVSGSDSIVKFGQGFLQNDFKD